MEKSLREILQEINEWQDRTFPTARPETAASHLRREAQELFDDPYDESEMADVFILVAGVAHLAGVDLVEAVEKKMAINRGRKWQKPDGDGVVEHVRDTSNKDNENPIGYIDPEDIRYRLTEYLEKLPEPTEEQKQELGMKDWKIRMRLTGELPG